MPRIAYLESIRSLAAVQVVLLHAFSAFAPDLVFALPAGSAIANAIHLSPLYFLYDGYSAVYIFFVLSGYVLTPAFERQQATPLSQIAARIVRLGVPALAAVLIAALLMLIFDRANMAAGALSGSAWFSNQWDSSVSFLAVIRDGFANALFLGYSGLSGVAFLAPWQQPANQSFVTPLWTLSIEFYGSIIVLALCWCARRSRPLWRTVALLGAVFTIRSAYICFFVGHFLAVLGRAERPAPAGRMLPVCSVLCGIFICVLAEVWQPEWLRSLSTHPTALLFPGQFAPMQQKTFGAILVLIGLIEWQAARDALSRPWLVARSQLSFPLYLIHWPILCGPSAALFLILNDVIGLEWARLSAIVVGIGLAFAASILFLPVDRRALELSRALRTRISGRSGEAPRAPTPAATATATATE